MNIFGPKFLFFMHGLKSTVLAIFQKGFHNSCSSLLSAGLFASQLAANSLRKLTQPFWQSFDFMLENWILQNPFRILLKPIIWVIRESCIFIYADDINLQKYASNVASIQSQKSKTIPRSALRSEPNTLR